MAFGSSQRLSLTKLSEPTQSVCLHVVYVSICKDVTTGSSMYRMFKIMLGSSRSLVWFRGLFCWLMYAVWAATLSRARNSGLTVTKWESLCNMHKQNHPVSLQKYHINSSKLYFSYCCITSMFDCFTVCRMMYFQSLTR